MPDASNLAHIHGSSGTFVMPAHSPYDRQILRDYVARFAGAGAELTVGLRGLRWVVTRRGATQARCTACTRFLGRLRCSHDTDRRPTCIDCAFGAPIGSRTTEGTHE